MSIKMSWTVVRFGSADLSRVTDVAFSNCSESIEFADDNNRYPVVIANNINRPRCSITSGDVATLMAIAPGTKGTILAEQSDGSGAGISWVMANAVHQATDDTGRWGHFATATATFRAHAADAVTNPLSFSAATGGSCRPPGSPRAPAPDALMIPESMRRGRTTEERVASIAAIADPILRVDVAAGERAYVRRQGDGRLFVTKDPSDTLYFPLDHPRRGEERYRWLDRPDGIRCGKQIPE